MKLIDLDNSWGEGILQDWYIHSVNPDDIPQWTDEHIEELCKDFYVIPKETTKYDIDCNPDRLKELVEEYKEGRRVVLPCKVGDIVFTYCFFKDSGTLELSEYKIYAIETDDNTIIYKATPWKFIGNGTLPQKVEWWFNKNIGKKMCFFYERRKKGVGGEKRMTDIEKVKLKSDEAKIALHYGKVHQALKLFEEFGECEEALRGYINGTDTKEHAIEEIADVEVMLDQFKCYFLSCEKQVEDVKRAKVDRQLERMEAGK